ncbi:MAG: aldo/keto reductase [Gammaproteobacteria bacterium]|nr:aldo/keto reductase [Gammaproteobacteria bacterium]
MMDTNTIRAVGKSRLAVTPLGFGGGTIGSPAIGNEASFATVAAAWETGVRFYEERRIGVVIAAPYASGWLADPSGSATYMYAPAPPEVVARSERMHAICEDHGVPLAAAALQFPLAHPAVATVIPGAKSPEEPVASRRNLDTEVPDDVWRRFKAEGLLEENAPTP